LLGDTQVAIFRSFEGRLYALDNRDPFTGAYVLSRGIVGSRRFGGADVPIVISPMLKQAFDLRDGRCLDSEDVGVPVYAIRERDGVVEISLESKAG
jgi:nitrite reductase (NADH) small subunit